MTRILLSLLLISQVAFSQEKAIQQSISSYLNEYINPYYSNRERYRVEKVVMHGSDTIELQLNEPFLGQPFNTATVEGIYRRIRERMPAAFRQRPLLITVCGHTLHELIPAYLQPQEGLRTWGGIDYKGEPWLKYPDRKYTPTGGMQGRHLAIWASHGRYFKNDKDVWTWQRPVLHTTCEDVFTSTVVYPFLMPMLERAGAIVFSPRERSWQKREVTDGRIREDGIYPVYVRYTESRRPLHVTVTHEGMETHVEVNRNMGAGVWCYLGEWQFRGGDDHNNRVTTNDADTEIRLGGGMGSIPRGERTSGFGRAWEGSRYWAEYNRMPEAVWTTKGGTNDYAEDINARSLSVNHVARGSVFLPKDSIDKCNVDTLTGDTIEKWREERDGLHVPIELSLAVHSDAGQTNGGYIGTLGIYTTDFQDGKYPAGLSRLAGRDLADEMLATITRDMTATYGTWNRRQLYERNYSESREPRIPCMILEMLSHQNYEDMKIGLDPVGRFTMARAIYKTLLRYTHRMHGEAAPTVAPLPIKHLMAVAEGDGHTLLRWTTETDPLEPTAQPTGYIIYIKRGAEGWDNGTFVAAPAEACSITTQEGVLYQFRVTAVNAGGESLDSPTVCAMDRGTNAKRVLLTDGFSRVAAPEPYDGDFHPETDPGVPYLCEPKPSGRLQAGNTRDWSVRYAEDLVSAPYTISSATEKALLWVALHREDAVCLIYGAQRRDGYSHGDYTVLPPLTVSLLSRYAQHGGALMMTGAYVAEGLSDEAAYFAKRYMGWEASMSVTTDTCSVHGMSLTFPLPDSFESEEHYCVARVSSMQAPEAPAPEEPQLNCFPTMLYTETSLPAAMACVEGERKAITFGFPLELIPDRGKRKAILNASLKFLIP